MRPAVLTCCRMGRPDCAALRFESDDSDGPQGLSWRAVGADCGDGRIVGRHRLNPVGRNEKVDSGPPGRVSSYVVGEADLPG